MFRFRTWLLTLAAVLFATGPAMATFWPTCVGLPFVFGPLLPSGDTGVAVTPLDPGSADAMAAWRNLWQRGRYREAYRAARTAVQATPASVDAQHALVVSQLVNAASAPRIAAAPVVAQSSAPIAAPFDADWLDWFGPCPGNLETFQATEATTNNKIGCDCPLCDCPLCDCPLFGFCEAIFGGKKQPNGTVCTQCPAVRCCPQTVTTTDPATGRGNFDVRILRGKQGPTIIWIVREPLRGVTSPPSQAAAPQFVPQFPGLPFGLVPPVPPLPPPLFSEHAFTLPLPPPEFAPPPPPLVTEADFQPYIPVPVPPVEAAPSRPAQPRYVQATRFDPSESCETTPSMPAMATSDVRIHQNGGRVSVSSPHCQAQCDRVHGGPQGEIVLEGNVRFQSQRHGQTLTIEAQRVLFHPKSGQFVVENSRGLEQSRMNVAPVGCDASDRMSELLSEYEGRGFQEWLRSRNVQPSTPVTPVRVYGGIAP